MFSLPQFYFYMLRILDFKIFVYFDQGCVSIITSLPVWCCEFSRNLYLLFVTTHTFSYTRFHHSQIVAQTYFNFRKIIFLPILAFRLVFLRSQEFILKYSYHKIILRNYNGFKKRKSNWKPKKCGWHLFAVCRTFKTSADSGLRKGCEIMQQNTKRSTIRRNCVSL